MVAEWPVHSQWDVNTQWRHGISLCHKRNLFLWIGLHSVWKVMHYKHYWKLVSAGHNLFFRMSHQRMSWHQCSIGKHQLFHSVIFWTVSTAHWTERFWSFLRHMISCAQCVLHACFTWHANLSWYVRKAVTMVLNMASSSLVYGTPLAVACNMQCNTYIKKFQLQ